MTTTETAHGSSSNSLSTDSAPPHHHLLIVEDDASVAEVLATALSARGYAVQVASCAAAADDLITLRSPDLVLLDLGLPDRDGLELCGELRSWFQNPIIVITADGDETRKIAALDLGADDYVTKPFSMPELMARVRVALRHRALIAHVVDPLEIRLGDLQIDTGPRKVRAGERPLLLTRTEFDLLALLARNSGRLLTHSMILQHVWGERSGTTESLRVHMTNLRKKLGDGNERPQIETEAGVGYRLVVAGSPPGPA